LKAFKTAPQSGEQGLETFAAALVVRRRVFRDETARSAPCSIEDAASACEGAASASACAGAEGA
jgi:hypothetical protein